MARCTLPWCTVADLSHRCSDFRCCDCLPRFSLGDCPIVGVSVIVRPIGGLSIGVLASEGNLHLPEGVELVRLRALAPQCQDAVQYAAGPTRPCCPFSPSFRVSMCDGARVFVADDHRMFRDLMERFLSARFEVVPGASTLAEADVAFRHGGFDVAIVDVSWGKEGPVTPRLKRWYLLQPQCHVIILTALDDWFVGRAFLAEGARGYMGKRSDFREVLDAIDAVMAGGTYMGRTMVPHPPVAAPPMERQLPAEAARVLDLLSEGWSRKAIAAALCTHIKTVDYHIARIKRLFGVPRSTRPEWRRLRWLAAPSESD